VWLTSSPKRKAGWLVAILLACEWGQGEGRRCGNQQSDDPVARRRPLSQGLMERPPERGGLSKGGWPDRPFGTAGRILVGPLGADRFDNERTSIWLRGRNILVRRVEWLVNVAVLALISEW